MRDYWKKQSYSVVLFDQPNITALADNEVIKTLTERVNEDPDIEIPENLTKVSEKVIHFDYKVPTGLPLGESHIVAMEVLDGFLSEKMGFHILEPVAQVKTEIRI